MTPPTSVAADSQITGDAAALLSILESVPINVMCADKEGVILYINRRSRETLKSIERVLPVKVDEIVGRSFDVFHKDPSLQRKRIATDSALPIDVFINVGDQILDLVVTPMYGEDGKYIGPMATWDVVTESKRKDAEINRVMKDLAGSAEELTAVSQEMASNAEQTTAQASMVADAARQVSANVQTVASGTEEMSASTQEIAQNASRAASVANEAMGVAEETNKTVAKLGDSSIEIGQVIKVITSIAQQTNLLALNATIEAARAGDAGKGFAVVANEVKELAKETAKATEDIGAKIEAIQTDTKNSVTDIERITTIIRQINDIQGTIASAVEEQSVTANEMARNVADANRATDEISQNISTVAEASKDAAQGTAGVQLAAAELSKMAVDLEGLVGDHDTH